MHDEQNIPSKDSGWIRFFNIFSWVAIVLGILFLINGVSRVRNGGSPWHPQTFIGIFILVVAAISRYIGYYTKVQTDIRGELETDLKTCPHCQSKIPIKATACKFCTRDV
jgi:hypothetical protein